MLGDTDLHAAELEPVTVFFRYLPVSSSGTADRATLVAYGFTFRG
jgi:hypothetical protein